MGGAKQDFIGSSVGIFLLPNSLLILPLFHFARAFSALSFSAHLRSRSAVRVRILLIDIVTHKGITQMHGSRVLPPFSGPCPSHARPDTTQLGLWQEVAWNHRIHFLITKLTRHESLVLCAVIALPARSHSLFATFVCLLQGRERNREWERGRGRTDNSRVEEEE